MTKHLEKHGGSPGGGRRLAELITLQESTEFPGITAQTFDHNLFVWDAYIDGPDGTPFEGFSFWVRVEVPSDYPFKAPKFRFMIPVYHPDVNRNGLTCFVPSDNWSPQTRIVTELVNLQVMLKEPHIDDPLEPEIAQQYRNNRQQYNKTAKEWAKKYATKKTS